MIERFKIFFSLVFRDWWYEGIDKWHPWKHRISISTAWKVAKIFTS
jgi:hypothetical protein